MVRLIRKVNQLFAPVQRPGNTILSHISNGKNNFMTSGLIECWPHPTSKTVRPLKAFAKTAVLCSSEASGLKPSVSLSFVNDFSHSPASWSPDSDSGLVDMTFPLDLHNLYVCFSFS